MNKDKWIKNIWGIPFDEVIARIHNGDVELKDKLMTLIFNLHLEAGYKWYPNSSDNRRRSSPLKNDA